MTKAIIFDIDGTLADIEHRRHFVRGNQKNWPAFEEGIAYDTPMQHVIDVLLAMKAAGKYTILIASGRGEQSREVTENWLRKYVGDYEKLYMRAEGDYRRDDIVKKEILDQMRSEGYEIVMTFDDRNQVVDMWRDNGIPCFQVAPGDF